MGHAGVLLVAGDPSTGSVLQPGFLARGHEEIVEHEGATWLGVRYRSVSESFYWPAIANDTPDASAYVEARARGVAARAATVAIDGKTIGTWALAKGQTRVVVARASAPVTLAPGGRELTLRFIGGARGGRGSGRR